MEENKPEVLINTGEAMLPGKIYLPSDHDPIIEAKKDPFTQAFADMIGNIIKEVLSKEETS